ncbi:hypothetical protein [Alicyclobacillus dauci]|uniref:Uncharacterized protein n=1 Tax=Alicyclobacillus dauci TaxID=1475485 RepID=A0ABY6Z371_9BACL|nr:hypothetical protein [Alicyclobacillus dauci]WAH37117.1 hypothetical protein NZD86_00620 [Alicyclobacillus dauci]
MPKKMSSRVGIAIAIAIVVLALSPDARRKCRQLVVKGVANLMEMIEQLSVIAPAILKQQSESETDTTKVSSTTPAKTELEADRHESSATETPQQSQDALDATHYM